MKNPTNEVLRHNYQDLQQKYLFLFNLLAEIQEITGHKGPVNELPGVVKKISDRYKWIEGDKPECEGWYWATKSIGGDPEMYFYFDGAWVDENERPVCYDILAYLPIKTPRGPHGPTTYKSARLSPWIDGDKPAGDGYHWVACRRGCGHGVRIAHYSESAGGWYADNGAPLIRVVAYIPISSPEPYRIKE